MAALFRLLEEYLGKEEKKLKENNIKLSVIGDTAELPEGVRRKLAHVIAATSDNTGLILNIALNYGSRGEIVMAVRSIASDLEAGKMTADTIDEGLFSRYLYTKDLPDPDLLIRTSGEFRVSNFLLWQIAYAELYVTKKLWPDFNKDDFKKAIIEYRERERRFGG